MNIYGLPFFIFLISFFFNILIILTKKSHIQFTGDTYNGPQKIHHNIVPRIGGISIFLTLLLSLMFLKNYYGNDKSLLIESFQTLILLSTPAFAIGFLEDIAKDISIILRFFTSFSVGVLAYFLFNLNVSITHISTLDTQIQIFNLIPFLTIFFFAGSINSINIIDGVNGLASVTCLIILLVLYALNNDEQVVVNNFFTILVMANIAGFLVINWFWGTIFLGDSGAYLLGTILAVLSCKIIYENELSMLIILTLFFFPVWEMSYSIWRRALNKTKVMRADNRHLHSLIHVLVREKFFIKNKFIINFLPTFILLPILAIGPIISLYYYQNPKMLIILFLTLYIFITLIYRLVDKSLSS